jgi:hypothetical protein
MSKIIIHSLKTEIHTNQIIAVERNRDYGALGPVRAPERRKERLSKFGPFRLMKGRMKSVTESTWSTFTPTPQLSIASRIHLYSDR